MPMTTMLVNSRPSRAGRPFAERVARDQHLRHDLGRAQIAHQRHGAGVAEAAGQRAADLGRDAQGTAVVLGDEDRSRPPARRRSAAATSGCRRRSAARPTIVGRATEQASAEPAAQVARQRGHRRERGGTAVVEPVEQLARAQAAAARSGSPSRRGGFQRGDVEPDQARPAVGGERPRRGGLSLRRHRASPR